MANEVFTFFQFSKCYADEFDWEENYAYVFKRKEDYDNFLKMMEIVKERHRGEVEYYFGTNEACYFDSGWAFVNKIKVTEITLDEFNLFVKFDLISDYNCLKRYIEDLFAEVATVEEFMKYAGLNREEAEEAVEEYHKNFDVYDDDDEEDNYG